MWMVSSLGFTRFDYWNIFEASPCAQQRNMCDNRTGCQSKCIRINSTDAFVHWSGLQNLSPGYFAHSVNTASSHHRWANRKRERFARPAGACKWTIAQPERAYYGDLVNKVFYHFCLGYMQSHLLQGVGTDCQPLCSASSFARHGFRSRCNMRTYPRSYHVHELITVTPARL